MEAALTFVPVAVILAVYTHGLIFTRTLCHPVFNLTKVGQGGHTKAWTSPLLPQTQEFGPPAPFTSSGSSEYFSGSLLAISSSFLETHTWLLPRQKAWQGRQIPPPTAEPTNSGRHCSQWLPWEPGAGSQQGWRIRGARDSGEGTGSESAIGGSGLGTRLGRSQPVCVVAVCLRWHTSHDGGLLPSSPKCRAQKALP